ncbi:acyltransferase family protein [Telmatobacter bradus]|uniref:acyltransferase family protein n=1 Tax=Telmatobacter bradus TaxID=474953 RepID=UPI003B431DF7
MHIQKPVNESSSAHLDALRGLAAISVFFCHSTELFPALRLPHSTLAVVLGSIFTLGHEWVIVFFVLSGYFVGGGVLRSRNRGSWSWKNYLIQRLARLYVVLIPALILGALFDGGGAYILGKGAAYPGDGRISFSPSDVRTTLTAKVFLANLFFQQHFRIPYLGSNGPLWSLSNEFWYYIFFPIFLIIFNRKTGPNMKGLLTGAFLLWCWYVRLANVLLFIPWLLGVALAILPEWKIRTERMRRTLLTLSVAQFVGVMAMVGKYNVTGTPLHSFFGHHLRSLPTSLLVVTVSSVFLISTILLAAHGQVPSFYKRCAKRAAGSSYTLYLVHAPALVLLEMIFHLPMAESVTQSVLAGIAVMLVVWLYAQLVYECFEKRTPEMRRWVEARIGSIKVRPVTVSS